MNLTRRLTTGLLLAVGLPLPLSVWAETKQLRLGTLAPKNSVYHQQLLLLGEAWKAAEGKDSKFVVFTDGSQGGETEIARRMRIGQLQGALMSVVGLREIDPNISALQSLPLLFRSWAEVDHVREKMRPAIEKRFADKGFIVISWGDAGWVRFFSKEPAFHPDDYKKMKFFTWGSEPEQQSIMRSLGYNPVALETADILPAMQTGMVSAVPATPYFALSSQIFGPAPNMLELNWAPIVGAVVVTQKAWDALSPAGREALKTAGEKAGLNMRNRAREEVEEAVEAMKKRGLIINKPNAEQLTAWQALADKLYPKLRGTLIPAETFDEVFMHLKAYRASGGK